MKGDKGMEFNLRSWDNVVLTWPQNLVALSLASMTTSVSIADFLSIKY
jgi:hypothetical protein